MAPRKDRIPNRKTRRSKSGNHTADYRNSVGFGVEVRAHQDFVRTTVASKRAEIVERLAQGRQLREMPLLGAMFIEMARDDRPRAHEWLDRANDTLRSAIGHCALSGARLLHLRLHSQRLLNSMPHYVSVFLEDKLPSADWSASMYASIGSTAEETLTAYNVAVRKLRNGSGNSQTVGELKGELSEQAIHLLALRAASKIGSEAWSPAPAHFSEDHHAYFSNAYLQRSWDLTIQTRAKSSEPIEDSYTVQIKTSRNSGAQTHPSRSYTEDITMISLAEDLALPSDRYNKPRQLHLVHPGSIIRELLAESHSPLAEETLNQRTELLLDILG